MAKDPRRFVSFTLSEEQASWIETNYGGPSANKAEAIKAIIDVVIQDDDAVDPISNALPSNTTSLSGIENSIKTVLASIEMLIQKYMSDHPENISTRDLEATMIARWIRFKADRQKYMVSNAP